MVRAEFEFGAIQVDMELLDPKHHRKALLFSDSEGALSTLQGA